MRSASCWFLLAGAMLLLVPHQSRAGLIDHWKFDETSGLVAKDSGGAVANDGTWADDGGTELSWAPGLIGNAAVPTGAIGNNYFGVGSIEADGLTQLSYSVWVKPNLVQQGEGTALDNKGIFTTGNLQALRSGGPTANQFWGATWSTQNKFRIDSTGTFNSAAVYDGTEAEPEWIHLAFTWDGTAGNPTAGDEVVKTYINGVLANTAVRNVSQIIDDGSWQIGRDRNLNSNGRTFGGMIDDLVVVDQVLNPEQVSLVYSAGLNGVDAAEALGIPPARLPAPRI